MNWLNDNAMLLSQKTLDAAWARQRLTLTNIANVDTPGYKAKYAVFETVLQDRLDRLKNARHLSSSEIGDAIQDVGVQVRESREESMRLDGNNVNLDVEQLELTRTIYEYQFALRQISDQFTRLRVAIEGR